MTNLSFASERHENKGLGFGEEDYKKCGVCFKGVDNCQKLYLSCDHTFHDECLVKSMRERIRCPTCWREILGAWCYEPTKRGADQLSGSR